jgi:inositol hexakisphosphate/diphosphoinositol-pentakisphosphate kinase
MQQILSRMQGPYFSIQIFPEKLILEEPIEVALLKILILQNWPIVDCLMSFYSEGFPLMKAIAYADLRKPYLINDLRK